LRIYVAVADQQPLAWAAGAVAVTVVVAERPVVAFGRWAVDSGGEEVRRAGQARQSSSRNRGAVIWPFLLHSGNPKDGGGEILSSRSSEATMRSSMPAATFPSMLLVVLHAA
jgi:hypothetical protein